jgi:hypothetical protein
MRVSRCRESVEGCMVRLMIWKLSTHKNRISWHQWFKTETIINTSWNKIWCKMTYDYVTYERCCNYYVKQRLMWWEGRRFIVSCLKKLYRQLGRTETEWHNCHTADILAKHRVPSVIWASNSWVSPPDGFRGKEMSTTKVALSVVWWWELFSQTDLKIAVFWSWGIPKAWHSENMQNGTEETFTWNQGA